MWKDQGTTGTKGSENGIIIRDEEYKERCRITLERCDKYDAITCGIYGAMLHTIFCHEKESEGKYDAMKKDLQDFIDRLPASEEEQGLFYERFVEKYLDA
ncbi:MAG: hypothetical protein J6Y37_08045 [Paludibacteraceae bacterium]|nr:hypothetical protein [Paludibacteraceae bacterium]